MSDDLRLKVVARCRELVAQGWCMPANSYKEFDPELAEAIVLAVADEIMPLLEVPDALPQTVSTTAHPEFAKVYWDAWLKFIRTRERWLKEDAGAIHR